MAPLLRFAVVFLESCVAQSIQLLETLIEQSPVKSIQGPLVRAVTISAESLQLALEQL